MPPTHLSSSAAPLTSRSLTFREREDIALECARGTGVRAIARKLGRSPSTISREIRRNSATRGGDFDYRAITAQWYADRAARRPKAGKLATNPALRDYVQDRLAGLIAMPDGIPSMVPPWYGKDDERFIGKVGAGPQRGAGTDYAASEAGLPQGLEHAHQPRPHLSGALYPRSRRAEAGTIGLSALRASAAFASRTCS